MDTPLLLGFIRSCVLIEVVLATLSCPSMEELHEGLISDCRVGEQSGVLTGQSVATETRLLLG